MTSATPHRVPGTQRGATLIEVLVAVIIMAIGMLGMAAMQSITLRNSQGAMERTQAVVQTYTILDAMRANLTAARNGQYNMAMPSGNACAVPPAGSTLVDRDKNFWITSLQNTLGPSACGSVSCADRVCTITVRWDDSRASGGETAQQVVTVSRL